MCFISHKTSIYITLYSCLESLFCLSLFPTLPSYHNPSSIWNSWAWCPLPKLITNKCSLISFPSPYHAYVFCAHSNWCALNFGIIFLYCWHTTYLLFDQDSHILYLSPLVLLSHSCFPPLIKSLEKMRWSCIACQYHIVLIIYKGFSHFYGVATTSS